MKKFKEELLKLSEKYKIKFIENIIKSNKKIIIKLIFNKFDLLFDKELIDIFNKYFKNKKTHLSLTYYHKINFKKKSTI